MTDHLNDPDFTDPACVDAWEEMVDELEQAEMPPEEAERTWLCCVDDAGARAASAGPRERAGRSADHDPAGRSVGRPRRAPLAAAYGAARSWPAATRVHRPGKHCGKGDRGSEAVRFPGGGSAERHRSDGGRGRDPSGWEATTHLAYREWASEALGDERQVYARSTEGKGGELVFMPEGDAERFRAAAQAGRLVCPVPGCPYPRLTTRGPARRRHHFVHLQAPPDPAHQRAYERQVATELLADWIRATHPKSTVETDVPVGEVSVTVLVTGPAGAKFAVVFVDRRIGVDAWWDEDLELERAGMARGWIFTPRAVPALPGTGGRRCALMTLRSATVGAATSCSIERCFGRCARSASGRSC